MAEVDEILKEFLVECYENLDQLDQELVALESDAGNLDRLAAIFRMIHTIKGTSGFFGFGKLESVTHAGENLLSRLRDGELELDAERTSALLHLVDGVRVILGEIETAGEEGPSEFTELTERLKALQAPSAAPSRQPQPAPEPPPPEPAEDAIEGLFLFSTPAPPPARSASVSPAPEPPKPAKPVEPPRASAVSDATIRVNVDLLDDLMNLVGELVLARNQILQHTTRTDDSAFASTTQRLNLITTELQERVMKTRMQPIANVFNKFPRVVRDLSLRCDKKVDLRLQGKETELDRTIIEAIKDPLTHIIRNSVDHGIETPADRLAAGKPEAGTITMCAYHEGGQVNIEIADDGKGLDPDKVRKKAIEKGLVTAERGAAMTDSDAARLIFTPGFSTATAVTNVSGRGVGMDVVKTNIEKIGGVVDLQNRPGQGLTLEIKIPLTLAIVPALIVFCNGERFAIPQVSLLELVRLERDDAAKLIHRIHGTPVLRLRGRLLPLAYLREQLDLEPASDDGRAINIIVLQADKQSFGLVVDGVHDTEEIVVKPLGRELEAIPAFAGTTIMGDGRVALILDVLGLAQMSGALRESHEDLVQSAEEAVDDENRQSLLLCACGEHPRLAIPLGHVARLEEIDPATVERSSGHQVVQYRGDIMPLVDLARALGSRGNAHREGPLQVVVHAGRQNVGLVVDRIVDIVDEPVEMKRVSNQLGMLGSAVIDGRITDFVDVEGVLRRVDPSWAANAM